MQFTIGDLQLEADVEEGDSLISKHTGRELARLKLYFSCQGKNENDQALDVFERAKKEGLTSSGADGASTRWKAATKSWSYTGNQGRSTTYHHTWTIEEWEALDLNKLVIDGIELEPYKYEEKIDRDALVITARIRQSPEDREAFVEHFKEKEYFPVIRQGISEDAREMRFGHIIWSQEGDVIKRRIILVERAYDEHSKFQGILQPEFGNMQAILATVNSTVNELLTLLSNKGVLTQQEVDAVKQAGEERAKQTFREFSEVDDIDEWLDSEDE